MNNKIQISLNKNKYIKIIVLASRNVHGIPKKYIGTVIEQASRVDNPRAARSPRKFVLRSFKYF